MMNKLTIAAQTIKDTISAQEVGQAIGLEIRHGRCQCPFHGGKDFNCVLYKGNRGWYCHVCKSGGDVISFTQQYYKMSFKECITWFSDTLRMGLDIEGKIDPLKQEQAKKALQMRKNAIELQQWKDRMTFDLSLTAQDIVKKLEDVRDQKRPHRFGEEWDANFCAAVVTLPDAREFAEECVMNSMKEVHE
jgi:DNA primase